MSILSSICSQKATPEVYTEFLTLYPIVERHARVVFRDRLQVDREEAAAEAVASAFESYVDLKARGKDPIKEFPSVMATFAVGHVKDDRHVGGKRSSKDVLSRRAQQQHGFHLEPLLVSTRTSFENLYASVHGQDRQDAFEERFRDNTQTPVPDQVAFRIDFPAFLKTLSRRDRKLARFLALGHSGKESAAQFKLCPGRVTQLRQQWHREWLAFQGEAPAAYPVSRQGA